MSGLGGVAVAERAVGILVQVGAVAFGFSAAVLYGEKGMGTLVVMAVGSLAPFLALTFGLVLNDQDFRRMWLVAGSGLWLGNRFAASLPLASLPTGLLPAWVSPLLMGVALVLVWVCSRRRNESVLSTDEVSLVELKWSEVLSQLPGYESLSCREREVLELTLEGKTAKDIASVLSIAASTVASYRTRVYQKLGAGSTQEVLAAVARLMVADCESDEAPGNCTQSAKADYYRSLLILLLCVACSVLGHLLFRPYLVCIVATLAGLALCVCAWKAGSELSSIPPMIAGLSQGFALCAALYGRWDLGAFIAAFLSVCAFHSAEGSLWEFAGAPALAVSALIPGMGSGGILAASSPAMLLLSALLLVVTRLVALAQSQKIAAASASLVSTGEKRVMAYLEGRGLSELRAKICLLTAYGFDSAAIADALFVSTSTVSNYRSKAYADLGVCGKEEMVALLRRDAGFAGLLGSKGVRDED